jgi:hypothetical protein
MGSSIKPDAEITQALDRAINAIELKDKLKGYIDANTQHYTDISTGETVLYIETIPLLEFIKKKHHAKLKH